MRDGEELEGKVEWTDEDMGIRESRHIYYSYSVRAR